MRAWAAPLAALAIGQAALADEPAPPPEPAPAPDAAPPPTPPQPGWNVAPVFVPPQPPGVPLTTSRWKLPVRLSKRLLVLPDWTLTPHVTAEFGAPSAASPQAGIVSMGAAIGVGDIFEFGVDATVGLGDHHQLLPHARVQAYRGPAALIGLDFSMATEIDASRTATTVALRPSLQAPIWIPLGNIARIETGIGFSAFAPTDGATRGYFALAVPSLDPTLPRPAVPLAIVFSPTETFYLGGGTGFGVRAIEPEMEATAIRDGIFLPLTVRVGGTFVKDMHPVADLETQLSFPYAFLAAHPDQFGSDVWRLGMNFTVLAEL